MKILHTADWHLGKRLDFFSRIEEQKEVMDEICTIADREEVDMVIVAGDLFDAFHPSTEATELLYKTLKRLTDDGRRPVVAIAGNHDSPNMIDAPDPLARECGIIMIGSPNAVVNPLTLPGFSITQSVPGMIEFKIRNLGYPVRLLHTAYANEVRLKEFFGEDKNVALNESLADNWRNIADKYCDDQGVNLLTAHLYMNKKGSAILEEPDGEKPIRIGNADLVYSEAVPRQIQYTALGHLHGFRNVGSDTNPVIYSSSPLAYSFSEAGQQKYVLIVEAEPGKTVKINPVKLERGRQLVRKGFDDIDLAVEWLESHSDILVELTIESDTFISVSDRKRIMQANDGIIHLIPKVKNISEEEDLSKEINLDEDIRVLFANYFKSKRENQEPNEDLMQLFNEILQS